MDWVFVALALLSLAYVYANRKNIERHGFIFIKRTGGKDLIKNIFRLSPEFWKSFSRASLPISAIGMLFIISFLVEKAAIAASLDSPPIGLLLPSPTGSISAGKGFILVPAWLWLIAVAAVAIPHEIAHGLAALANGVRIKSAGLAFLLFIPGAFVEPGKMGRRQKALVASAGPSANLIIGFTLMGIVAMLSWLLFEPSGVAFEKTINGSDAEAKNLSGTILEVNGIRIRSVEDLARIKVGRIAEVRTTAGNYTIQTFHEGNRTLIGIENPRTEYSLRVPVPEGPISLVLSSLSFISLVSIGVGLANLIPLKPLDGGLLLEALVKNRRARKAISVATALAVAWVIIAPFLF